MGLIKKIKTKIGEKRLQKDLNKHLDAIEKAYYTLVSNYTFNKHFDWTEADYEELYDRVINHDSDKFSDALFEIYRKYLYPVNKAEKEAARAEFEEAVDDHKNNNRHHWQARIEDNPDEFTDDQKMDCFEEVLDMIARMGEQSLDYFEGFKNNMDIPAVQKEFMENILFDLYKSKESY